jgi:glycosyltransferase involved in cell wall biosynthesis
MKLSVVAPVLNEETFMPFYLESTTSFADEIVLVDGGSTDKTVDIIKEYQKRFNIKLFERPQKGTPYSNQWNESEVQSFLLRQATGDWILALDADEIIDDKLPSILPDLMDNKNHNLYMFPIINFWRDPWTVRVNAPKDERWSVNILRMWRNHVGIGYNDKLHHCNLQWQGKPIWEYPNHIIEEIPIYHYHYAIGKKIKNNDNRRGDVNMWDNTGEPDWNYTHEWYDIKLQEFKGQHPNVIQKYLKDKNIARP